MKRFIQVCIVVATCIALSTGVAFAGGSYSNRPGPFCAQMTPANEVPPTISNTTGRAFVAVRFPTSQSTIPSSLDFKVSISRGVGLAQMHLHCAPVGVRGPVVVFFAGRHDGGVNVPFGQWVRGNVDSQSISSTGTGITAPVTCNDPTGQPTGAVIATISDLVEQIQAGNIYAEAHDRQFPTGVIRDQLQQCRNFHDYNDDDDDD